MILVTVHDEVGRTWSNPACAFTESAAIRDFRTACSDNRTLMGQHPTDFKLYAIGEWYPSLDEDVPPRFSCLKTFKLLAQGELKNES